MGENLVIILSSHTVLYYIWGIYLERNKVLCFVTFILQMDFYRDISVVSKNANFLNKQFLS